MGNASTGYSAAQRLRCGGAADVRQALLAARARTLAHATRMADALGPAMPVPQAATLNPPLWELGHIGWFQEYWVGRSRQRDRGVLCDPMHARAPSLLAGADALYDSGAVAHGTRWGLALPDLEATHAYLAGTLAQTLALLDGLGDAASDDALYAFRLVALHEGMHAEAGAYMARALGIETSAPPAFTATLPPGELRVPAQVHRLGWHGPGFAFDNELLAHDVALDAFRIDAAPVSWADFDRFAVAGGYDSPRWWSDAGWAWRAQVGRAPPLDRDAAPHSAALHLSAHEAEAWCRWAGRRLPSEAEWECAALTAPGFQWGTVWEWTASDFLPYPGFVAHPYRDYSAPWFGTRRVLRGACAETSPSLAHPRYRNFFEPQRHDIFAGFRSCA
jgi:iron(II)-dependent oxidoreductase